MGSLYLVRYGRMGHLGRFSAGPDLGDLDRGRIVVVRTGRGTELGEILASSPSPSPSGDDILRVATDEDLGRARRADADRSRRLAECERIFGDGAWPLILVDAEPLLDEGRTVLYYMGPHHLDDDGLRDALRSRCGLDAVFEPVGLDAAEEETDAGPAEGGCGSCGSGGGCGSGGCGSASDGDDSTHRGGCDGCAVRSLAARRAGRVPSTT